MAKKKKADKAKTKKKAKKITAKKDFLIVQNDVRIEINKGDNIAEMDIPDQYIVNLKTEGVI